MQALIKSLICWALDFDSQSLYMFDFHCLALLVYPYVFDCESTRVWMLILALCGSIGVSIHACECVHAESIIHLNQTRVRLS